MKNIFITLSLFLALGTGVAFAKGGYQGEHQGFPGKGEGAVHSNAPSTGTQVKGKERAMEVGKGKELGLHKDQWKNQNWKKSHENQNWKKSNEQRKAE